MSVALQVVKEAFNCERCGRPLPVTGADKAAFAVTIFPKMAIPCLLHLSFGPDVIVCTACQHSNMLNFPLVVAEPKKAAVLYMPEGLADPAAPQDAILNMMNKMFGTVPVVVRTRRDFKREYLRAFVLEHINLLNSFIAADNDFTWVGAHQQALTPSFFTACWLAASGGIEMFGRPADQGQQDDVIAHETMPEADRHVARRDALLAHLNQQCGRLLATLIAFRAFKAGEARSFADVAATARTLPKVLFVSDIARSAAERIGEVVKAQVLGTTGAVAGRYLLDAAFALVFAEHEVENPRIMGWTEIAVLYDFQRRIEGNDETMLLDPEFMRKTLDRQVFLSVIRGFGAQLGELTEESAPKFVHLIETIGRVYPEEVNAVLPLSIVVAPKLNDDEAAANSVESLVRWLDVTDDPEAQDAATPSSAAGAAMQMTALLRGMQRTRPKIVEPVIRKVWADKARHIPAARAIAFAEEAIEHLNYVEAYRAAREIALEAESMLSDADDIADFARATFLNEVGNCLRYAGLFAAALQRYDESEALMAGKSERNMRVVARNRAIVLRSLQRYTEASRIFAKLREETFDAESSALSCRRRSVCSKPASATRRSP